MASSTTNLETISQSQSQKEVTANELFNGGSPATAFGRRLSSAGLTWRFYGGVVMVDGAATFVNNGELTLAASTTNYVERTRAGVVSSNTSGFTAGRIPLYTVVTGASTVTSYTDHRSIELPTPTGKLSKAVTTADVTLSHVEARCKILEFTGALTGNRNVIVPADPEWWIVYNNTSGAFTLTVKTGGTGVAVTQGQRAILYSDGTNVVRATADV